MDEMIIREMVKTKIQLIVLFLCSATVVVFCVIGVYDAIWNVPVKNLEIQRLTNLCDAKQSRINELDKYIIDREAKYRVATKFDQLFILVADPDQIMDFEVLEECIQNKKEFFVKAKMKGGK